MACSLDHLKKVASEGFPLRDELYGRQASKASPKQYVYYGPQSVTVIQEPGTGSCHQIQTAKNYDRSWYVCHVPQVSLSDSAAISSRDAAAYYGGMLLNDFGKNKQKQWALS